MFVTVGTKTVSIYAIKTITGVTSSVIELNNGKFLKVDDTPANIIASIQAEVGISTPFVSVGSTYINIRSIASVDDNTISVNIVYMDGKFAKHAITLAEIVSAVPDADTQHGILGGATLHAPVTQVAHGFMSKEDKIELDGMEEKLKRYSFFVG